MHRRACSARQRSSPRRACAGFVGSARLCSGWRLGLACCTPNSYHRDRRALGGSGPCTASILQLCWPLSASVRVAPTWPPYELMLGTNATTLPPSCMEASAATRLSFAALRSSCSTPTFRDSAPPGSSTLQSIRWLISHAAMDPSVSEAAGSTTAARAVMVAPGRGFGRAEGSSWEPPTSLSPYSRGRCSMFDCSASEGTSSLQL